MPPASPTPPNTQGTFFGIKVSKSGVPVQSANANNLQYENDFNTQTFYGTNGNIAFGVLNDGGLGMQTVDDAGNLLFKMDGQTWYWYDTQGNTVMMVGYLPIAQIFGWAVSAPGASLAGVV